MRPTATLEHPEHPRRRRHRPARGGAAQPAGRAPRGVVLGPALRRPRAGAAQGDGGGVRDLPRAGAHAPVPDRVASEAADLVFHLVVGLVAPRCRSPTCWPSSTGGRHDGRGGGPVRGRLRDFVTTLLADAGFPTGGFRGGARTRVDGLELIEMRPATRPPGCKPAGSTARSCLPTSCSRRTSAPSSRCRSVRPARVLVVASREDDGRASAADLAGGTSPPTCPGPPPGGSPSRASTSRS